MIFSLGIALVVVLLTGLSQMLLKIGSQIGKTKAQFLSAYLNPFTIGAYGIFLVITVLSVIALKEIPLKFFYVLMSLNFIIVIGLSWIIFKEKIGKNKIVALILIVSGIIVFNISI